jgi:dephospho-CoA kinase
MASPSRIGITGGIGSGKTTVCRLFELLGIPVYYADDRAKWLMAHDPVLRAQLIDAFGTQTFDAAGQLNRTYLSDVAFRDPARLAVLNSIVHPAVRRDGLAWEAAQTGVPYTLREAALLYESGSYTTLDRVIVVTAPETLRIQRVVARDGLTAAQVQARMDKQWPEAAKVRRAHHVIVNDGQHSLIRQALRIHHILRAL